MRGQEVGEEHSYTLQRNTGFLIILGVSTARAKIHRMLDSCSSDIFSARTVHLMRGGRPALSSGTALLETIVAKDGGRWYLPHTGRPRSIESSETISVSQRLCSFKTETRV